jgi:hypothetical protein
MFARVATFEGAEPGQLKEVLDEIRERSKSGPPEGVNGKALYILTDVDGGKVLSIGLFETEEDLKQGHEVLNSMDPPVPGGLGNRTSVDLMEVALQVEA